MSDTSRARSTSGDSASDQADGRDDRVSSDVRVSSDGGDDGDDLRVRHRPAWIAFVVLGAIFCLAMGYWQLSRYQAVSGTVQNLGYTFMWPFLAGFLVYAYLRYVKLEAEDAAKKADAHGDPRAGGEGPDGTGRGVDGTLARAGNHRDEGDDDELGGPAGGSRSRGRTRRGAPMTEIPADILPTRRTAPAHDTEDEALRAYNEYLAELARQDAEAARRDTDAARPDAARRDTDAARPDAARTDAAPEENTRR